MAESSDATQHAPGQWTELLFYSGAAFVFGFLLGLIIYFSDHDSATTKWGAYADLAAALGTWVAAVSAIVIAGVARKEVKRRENAERVERERLDKEALDLAVSVAAWPVMADMELAVRISRALPLSGEVTVERVFIILDWISRFSVPEELDDISKLIGLPQDRLRAICDCRAQLKMLMSSGLNNKHVIERFAKFDLLQIEYLVAQIEIVAHKMRGVSDYLYDEIGAATDRPWSGWEPLRDFRSLEKTVRDQYHRN